MHIHFYVNSSFPFGMAAAKRRLCYAKGLMAEGHIIDVVICQKCIDKDYDDGLPAKGVSSAKMTAWLTILHQRKLIPIYLIGIRLIS